MPVGHRLDGATMTTTAAVTVQRSRTVSNWFYLWMGVLCVLLPLGGFLGTYLVPLASGTFNEPSILHVHAVLAFAWTGLFVTQAWLIARGRVVRHEAVGLAGIALATATFFTGVIVAIKTMNVGIAAGNGEGARAFAIVPITIIVTFAGLLVAAVANIKRPEYHKRLMLMATISIMPPAMGRLIGMAAQQIAIGPRQLGATIAPVAVGTVSAVAADLLIVAAMAYEWRTRGRAHRVYWIAGGAIVLIQLLRIPISATGSWMRFTEVLSSLAQ